MKEQEQWRPIPGYEGLYSVSDHGRVRSETARNKWAAGRILKPGCDRTGYLHVNLCRDSNQRSMLVHRLVMLTFVGPCPEGQEVAHADGDPTNNNLSNLRYASSSENKIDCHRYGGRTSSQKLTLTQVAEIRVRLAAGETQTSIAFDYGVSPMAISHINTGKHWGHRLDQELEALDASLED